MREILVVDLDGTLLKSDILIESFWSALGKDWRSPMQAAKALFRGRAYLKRVLAQSSDIDVATLPYNTQVLAFIKNWRDAGGRTALVTATEEKIAREIGNSLKLFDEVHGSNGRDNLKGKRKADFLIERYGEKKFSYMGDSEADLLVWKHARRAITVGASNSIKERAEKLAEVTEHLDDYSPQLSSYLRALRPHQWLKNILVFLPVLAAHQIDGSSILFSTLAFIAFSIVASSVYVLNDLLDLKDDRAHPRKRNRPFAAGDIPIKSGVWMATGLLLVGTFIAILIGLEFLGVMIAYYVLTTFYSLNLKKRIVVDICALAGLYTLRIIAGGAATQIPLSVWLLAFSVFLFLSLAAVKRQAELVGTVKHGEFQETKRGYHVDDLPIIAMISISAGYVSVLVMALYLNSPAVLELYSYPEALWGICAILLYWITRTVMLAHRGWMHDDPVIYAVKDRLSQISFLMVLLMVLGGAAL